jgi:ribosomal protein S12 methylthiotransferase accessory factor
MLKQPAFKASLTVEVVEPDGVFLLSEQGHHVLQGHLYRRLAPLLNGRHTSDQLVEKLSDIASPAEVCYSLLRLAQRGFLAAPPDGVPVERAAFWHAAGHNPVDAERRLCSSRASLECFGTVDSEPLAMTLRELGCSTGPSSGLDEKLTVVLTDDYLRDGLDDVNRRSLEDGRPWLLAKPVGSIIWIGPLFRPGQGPCWECLAQRLRPKREVDQ